MSNPYEALQPGGLPFAGSPDLFEYPGLPGFLVRPVGVTPGRAAETASLSRELLHELQDKYGMDVVPFSVAVIDSAKICYVSEKIEGRGFAYVDGKRINHVKSSDLTERQFRVAEALLGKHYDYLTDKITTKQPFLGDIFGIPQYVLTSDDRAVLVDIGSGLCDYQNTWDDCQRLRIEAVVVADYAKSVVELFGENMLGAWRAKVEELMVKMMTASGLPYTPDKAKELTAKVLREGLSDYEDDEVEDEITEYLRIAYLQARQTRFDNRGDWL